MMKGIWFDNVHSYDDLNLVLSKTNIPPATPKTTYVDIPGGDGSADLTEALGEVRYKDRKCKFTFTVFPYEDFEEKKTYISNLLNGRRCQIKLDKDPDYYWQGRCSIDSYASNKNIGQIVVGANVSPYKLKVNPTSVTVPAGTAVAVTLTNGRKTVIPTITTGANATIVIGGATINLNAGTHRALNIVLGYGETQLTVTSSQPVTFVYQEGDL